MKPSLIQLLAVPALVIAGRLEQRQINWTVGQIVQTDSGPVSGHAALNASLVSEYLGIPFAAPPVGDLRFAAPQKYTGNSSINGTSFVRSYNLVLELQSLNQNFRDFLAPQRLSPQRFRQRISQVQTSQLPDFKFWKRLRNSGTISVKIV